MKIFNGICAFAFVLTSSFSAFAEVPVPTDLLDEKPTLDKALESMDDRKSGDDAPMVDEDKAKDEPEKYARKKKKKATPAFWHLKTPNNNIYFLGSLHVLVKKMKYPKNVMEAFHSSENLVVEVDIRKYGSALVERYHQKEGGMLNLGWRIEDLISDKTYRDLQTKAAQYKMDMVQLNAAAPWAVAQAIASLPTADNFMDVMDGNVPKIENGADSDFLKRAQRVGKPVHELETFKDQFVIFSTLPMDLQVEWLEFVLEHRDGEAGQARQMFLDMTEAWTVGDTERLENLLWHNENISTPSEEYDAATYKNLLVTRNNAWIPVIRSYMNQDQDYFIVAGAAHFIGPDSVIALLRKEGHDVKRIFPETEVKK